MNILPLVFSLLIIFSYLCTTFLKEVKSYQLIELTLEGYNHTEKAIQNALIKRSYEKIKEDAPLSIQNTEPLKKCKVFTSRRVQFPPLETSKFYLKALTKTEIQLSQNPLYEPLAELLRLLYQKTVFDKYPTIIGAEYKLIEALVKKSKQFPTAPNLSYLYPNDPELQRIYYKILKGTNCYTEEEGIPPLFHFLSVENMDKVAHLSLASPPVLKALFGAPMTEEILRIEKEHWETTQKQYALSKEDLQTLCMKDPSNNSMFTTFEPYLSYSKQVAKKKSLAKRDKITGIGIEKEL